MRRILLLGASLAVSAFFLWLALQDVPLQEVITRIQQAHIGWLVTCFFTVILAIAARTVRWRGLLGGDLPYIQLFHIFTITFVVNLLPMRIGEVVRTLLARRLGVPIVTGATSIVVEKVLDTLMVVLMLSIGLMRLPIDLPAASQAAAAVGVVSVLAFVVLMLLARYPAMAHALFDRVEAILPFIQRLGLRRLLDNVLAGLRPLTNWRQGLHALVWTLISWSVSLITFITLEFALNVQDADYGVMALLAVSLASFSIAMPVSVAAIGPFEGAVRLAGEGVQMAAQTSTSLGFLFHGMTILSYAVLGSISMLLMGISLGDVLKVARQSDDAPED